MVPGVGRNPPKTNLKTNFLIEVLSTPIFLSSNY